MTFQELSAFKLRGRSLILLFSIGRQSLTLCGMETVTHIIPLLLRRYFSPFSDVWQTFDCVSTFHAARKLGALYWVLTRFGASAKQASQLRMAPVSDSYIPRNS